MKKLTLLLALAIVAGASCSEANAKDKKKKVTETAAPQKEIITLQSKSDSISYSAGQAMTQGMMEFVIGQLKLDSAYTNEFVAALKERLALEETPQLKAKAAAENIAATINDRMIPGMKQQLEGTGVELNENLFKRGFTDAVDNDASIFSVEEAAKYQQTTMKALKDEIAAKAKAEGKAWLDENAKKEGVKVLPSGLQYKVIKEGNGAIATKDDEVTVKYEGCLLDGTVFDSSYTRNPDTTTFKPTQVIKGWTEALCMMPEGSEWELYIPEDLAYGERAMGKIPAYSTLKFKVEVVSVKKAEEKKVEEAAKETTNKTAKSKTTTAKKSTAKKVASKK